MDNLNTMINDEGDWDGGTWENDPSPDVIINGQENQSESESQAHIDETPAQTNSDPEHVELGQPVIQDELAIIDLSQNEETYFHEDRYCKIWYEKLETKSERVDVPIYGIFTCGPGNVAAERQFCGIVTNQYKFMANNAIVDAVLQSLSELGGGNVVEGFYISSNYTNFRADISVVQRAQEIVEAGTVIPTVVVENSYNGSKAASYSCGLEIQNDGITSTVTFRHKISSMRQVHIVTSRTSMTSDIGRYMQVFEDNIVDVINQSINTILTPEDVMKSLAMVEKIGKKRYQGVTTNLAAEIGTDEIDPGNPPAISAWKLFMAIAKFSALEENLNAKRLLDNLAERTLVIPTRMIQALT